MQVKQANKMGNSGREHTDRHFRLTSVQPYDLQFEGVQVVYHPEGLRKPQTSHQMIRTMPATSALTAPPSIVEARPGEG